MKMPKKFPVSLDAFLRLVVKRKHADRRRHYKQFISGDRSKPSQKETEAIVAKHAKEGFTEDQFKMQAAAWDAWEPNIRKLRAQTAARKRWRKG